MFDRMRPLLVAIALTGVGIGGIEALTHRTLSQADMLGLFAVACLAAVLLNRMRREDPDDDEDQPYRVSDQPPGRGYEESCKEILRGAGWQIVPTPKSRDRGADIFAIKGSTKLIVQCKDYKKVVRYKAISEVIAAAKFYPADHLCVVAPCRFTDDAKRGAREGGVKLLHHDELRRWARRLA